MINFTNRQYNSHSEKTEEYSTLDSQLWASENVYDRGRINQIQSAVEQQNGDSSFKDKHTFFHSEYSLKIIPNVDLEFNETNLIGSTRTAKVFYGRLKSRQLDEENIEDVAIKQITLKSVTQQELIKTIGPWSKIKNVHVVEIKGLCHTNDLPLIVMERGKGGVLKDFLRKINFKIPIRVVLKWLLQITDALIEIHANDVIHGDLASGNIVMSNNGETIKDMESNILKLIDVNDTEAKGTPLTMSPESFDEIKSKESEVYSLFCLAWELLTRHKEQPFEGHDKYLKDLNPFDFFKLVAMNKKTLKIPSDCNLKLAELMKKSWNHNPKERPSLSVIRKELNDLLKSDELPENVLEYDTVQIKEDDKTIQYDLLQNDEEYESQDEEYSSDETSQPSDDNDDNLEDYSDYENQNEVKPGVDGIDFDIDQIQIPNLF